MSQLTLPIVECGGDAQALGHAQGEQLRERIAAFIDQRLTAFAEYSRERGGPSVEEFLAAGAACLRVYERGTRSAAEHRGMPRPARSRLRLSTPPPT